MGMSEPTSETAAKTDGDGRSTDIVGVDSDEEHDELELEAVRGDDGIIGLDVENAVITEIVPGSFAERAGVFRVGDRIKCAFPCRTGARRMLGAADRCPALVPPPKPHPLSAAQDGGWHAHS